MSGADEETGDRPGPFVAAGSQAALAIERGE
jgi:hypothetical protein